MAKVEQDRELAYADGLLDALRAAEAEGRTTTGSARAITRFSGRWDVVV